MMEALGFLVQMSVVELALLLVKSLGLLLVETKVLVKLWVLVKV